VNFTSTPDTGLSAAGADNDEFVQARQAETRPELQLFRHGSRYHPAAEVLGEQGETRGGGEAFGQQRGVGAQGGEVRCGIRFGHWPELAEGGQGSQGRSVQPTQCVLDRGWVE